MKQYLLVFRADWGARPAATPEEAQARTKSYMDWVGGIAAQNKLVDKGNRLMPTGKVLRTKGSSTDGPYAEIKETIGGYSIIRANSYEEAIELAEGCPVLKIGGCVEVREINPL